MYEPYPVCFASDVFSSDLYDALSGSYPDVAMFSHKPELGDKFSLSEKSFPERYHRFLNQNQAWKALYDYVKSDAFILDHLELLKTRNIDLGLKKLSVRSRRPRKGASLMSRITRTTEISARFEFSMMRGQGGHIRPHTDDHRKLLTFVLSMAAPGEWDQSWGGGTQVCLPKDRTKTFNFMNKFMEFEDVDIIRSYPFQPNQCILFIKTYNSWHQVAPIQAPENAPMRKTLTINIEQLL